MDIQWTREGKGYDIEYVARSGGVKVASVYRGGIRGYPFSVNVPGTRLGACATLSTAKESVERHLRNRD